jgi:hypothetical protein
VIIKRLLWPPDTFQMKNLLTQRGNMRSSSFNQKIVTIKKSEGGSLESYFQQSLSLEIIYTVLNGIV